MGQGIDACLSFLTAFSIRKRSKRSTSVLRAEPHNKPTSAEYSTWDRAALCLHMDLCGVPGDIIRNFPFEQQECISSNIQCLIKQINLIKGEYLFQKRPRVLFFKTGFIFVGHYTKLDTRNRHWKHKERDMLFLV